MWSKSIENAPPDYTKAMACPMAPNGTIQESIESGLAEPRHEPLLGASAPPAESDAREPREELNALRICGMRVDTAFIVHTVISCILLVPLMAVSVFVHGLIIIPFTYFVLLVASSVWQKIPALQMTRVFAYIQLIGGVIAMFIVPSIVAHETRYAGPGIFFGSLIALYILWIACQLFLVTKVLEIAIVKREKKRRLVERYHLNQI